MTRHTLRLLMLLAALLALPFAASAAQGEQGLPVPPQAATPAPTPIPASTPARASTEAWLTERAHTLRLRMARFGGLSGTALEERVRAMDVDPDKPMIALTFDDGPVAGVTDEILHILSEYDARATFFVLGKRGRFAQTPDLLRQILAEGSEIGSHTYEHLNLRTANGYQILSSLDKTDQMVYDATQTTMRLMRPPGGRTSAAGDRYAKQRGMAVVLWTQSGNVHEQDPARIAENVFCQYVNGKLLEDGDIVLLHDTKPWMVEAVRIMVPRLISEGYQLVTVSELIDLSEDGFVAGKRYRRQDS